MSLDVNKDDLLRYIDRIERVDDELDNLKADRKEIMKELKAVGFDPKAFSHVIKERKRSKQERDEERAIFSTYEAAAGIE